MPVETENPKQLKPKPENHRSSLIPTAINSPKPPAKNSPTMPPPLPLGGRGAGGEGAGKGGAHDGLPQRKTVNNQHRIPRIPQQNPNNPSSDNNLTHPQHSCINNNKRSSDGHLRSARGSPHPGVAPLGAVSSIEMK